jgi:hypothetical protein
MKTVHDKYQKYRDIEFADDSACLAVDNVCNEEK